MEKPELWFDWDHETKTMMVFVEDRPQAGGPRVVGSLYVRKTAWEAMGQPMRIRVTIEPE